MRRVLGQLAFFAAGKHGPPDNQHENQAGPQGFQQVRLVGCRGLRRDAAGQFHTPVERIGRGPAGGDVVDGKLYGNIFQSNTILRIDPASGCVEASADLGSLWRAMTDADREALEAVVPEELRYWEAGLDPATRHELVQRITRLQEARGFALLVISHDLPDAASLATRTVVPFASRVSANSSSATTRPTTSASSSATTARRRSGARRPPPG